MTSRFQNPRGAHFYNKGFNSILCSYRTRPRQEAFTFPCAENSKLCAENRFPASKFVTRRDTVLDFSLARNLGRVRGSTKSKASRSFLRPFKVLCYVRHGFDDKISSLTHKITRNDDFSRFFYPRCCDLMSRIFGPCRKQQQW